MNYIKQGKPSASLITPNLKNIRQIQTLEYPQVERTQSMHKRQIPSPGPKRLRVIAKIAIKSSITTIINF
jgi:hypothetical protein